MKLSFMKKIYKGYSMLLNPFKYSEKPTFCRFFRSLSSSEINYHTNAAIHIFTEDVYLGVMPIGGYSSVFDDFSVNISGDEFNKGLAIKLLGSLSTTHEYSECKLVCDVVTNIVQSMNYQGVALYEVTRDTDKFFKLHYFTSKNLLNIFGLAFQLVPKLERKLWNKYLVVKTFNSIWKIEIPKKLGGRTGYSKIINGFLNDSTIYPKCFEVNELFTKPYQFNVQEYAYQKRAYEYKLLRLWGGNLRNDADYVSEYYFVYRLMKFNRSQALLREHIISELNILFIRLGIKSEIKISGLPTSEFIDEQIKNLECGALDINSAIKSTQIS